MIGLPLLIAYFIILYLVHNTLLELSLLLEKTFHRLDRFLISPDLTEGSQFSVILSNEQSNVLLELLVTPLLFVFLHRQVWI